MKLLLPCSLATGMVLASSSLAQIPQGLRGEAEGRTPLAQVEAAEVLVLQSDVLFASIHAEGVLSSPCGSLDTPTVQRNGNVFRVQLRERDGRDRFCQSLGRSRTPFYLSLPLELEGLRSGTYRVLVNDLDLEFRIP